MRAHTTSLAGGLRLLYVTDRRLVLCHMAGPLYPIIQLILFTVVIRVPDVGLWLDLRRAATLMIVAIPVARCYVRFRRIDQVLPLAEIEAIRPALGQDHRSLVLWLRGGPTWILRYPRQAGFMAAPNVVRAFRRARKSLHELVAGRAAVR